MGLLPQCVDLIGTRLNERVEILCTLAHQHHRVGVTLCLVAHLTESCNDLVPYLLRIAQRAVGIGDLNAERGESLRLLARAVLGLQHVACELGNRAGNCLD